MVIGINVEILEGASNDSSLGGKNVYLDQNI
jgi:hypothetical protein